MKALILAAGNGTRLKQLTKDRPKPMLPLSGKPLLGRTIAWLREQNVTEIAINVHHHPKKILDYCGDGSKDGVALFYSHEDRLLGTAGAAKRLQSFFLDEPFVLVYGDVATNLRLARLIAIQNDPRHNPGEMPIMTLALHKVSNPTECGIVRLNTGGRISEFVEKPAPDQVFSSLVFSGVAVCRPDILLHIPRHVPYDFGADLIPKLIRTNCPVYGEEIRADEYVVDIGTLNGYLRALRIVNQVSPSADHGHSLALPLPASESSP